MPSAAEHEQIQLLGAFEYDSLTNSLQVADAATLGHLVDGTDLGFYTGPWGCIIREITIVAFDLTFTDPAADRWLGYTLDYTTDGGVGYTNLIAATADSDLPQIWDDTGNDTEDFTVEVPLNLSGFHSVTTFGFVVPGDAAVRLRLGIYNSGSLAAITGLDNVFAYVYGRSHGLRL